MLAPKIFTMTPEDQTGDVYGTEFVFSSNLSQEYNEYIWMFGDGRSIYGNKSTVNHIYNYPGIYSVDMSAWDAQGDLVTDFATIEVDYAYRDAVVFSSVPSSPNVVSVSSQPFVVSLTSANITQPLSLVFQSNGSTSTPHYVVPPKWSGITPKWRFVNAATGNIINGPLIVPTTPVYKNSRVVAVKGEVSISYIDDLPSSFGPLLLLASLSTERLEYPPESLVYPYPSYSNNEQTRASIYWSVSSAPPTRLKVTENFINDIYPLKWATVPIPVMITTEADILGRANNIPILAYPQTNELGASSLVNIALSSSKMGRLTSDVYFSKQNNLKFTGKDEYNNPAGGYIFTSIVPTSAVINHTLKIIATTNIKYDNGITVTTTPVTGISAPFTVYDLNKSFKIAKTNEEFDCSSYFKSLALPEVLSQNTNLFDNFFAAVVGNEDPTKESLGRVSYEKIANFVNNHGDVETADLRQLTSLAEQLAVDAKNFGQGFPEEITRLIHLFSVSKKYLRGIPNLINNFEDNVGPFLNKYNYVYADRYYLIKDKIYGEYQLLYLNKIGNTSMYQLINVQAEGLRKPIVDNYYFFEYDATKSNGYLENVVNWDSKNTTITYNMSSNEQWYGENGIVETMFNNLLTKRLLEE